MSFPECQWWGSTIELVSNVHIYKNEPIISFKSRPEVTYFVIYYSHIYNPDKLENMDIKTKKKRVHFKQKKIKLFNHDTEFAKYKKLLCKPPKDWVLNR